MTQVSPGLDIEVLAKSLGDVISEEMDVATAPLIERIKTLEDSFQRLAAVSRLREGLLDV